MRVAAMARDTTTLGCLTGISAASASVDGSLPISADKNSPLAAADATLVLDAVTIINSANGLVKTLISQFAEPDVECEGGARFAMQFG